MISGICPRKLCIAVSGEIFDGVKHVIIILMKTEDRDTLAQGTPAMKITPAR